MQAMSVLDELEARPSARPRQLVVAALIACLLLLVAGEPSARAAFPGANGKIAVSTLSDWGEFDIFVMNADGSGWVPLTVYGADDSQPAFSPDGSRIAFTSNRTGDAEIFVMDADGTAVTQVTHNAAQDFDPAFSADGSTIAFTSDRDGNREIYMIGTDGSGEMRLTTNPGNEGDPTYSADGSRLAFTSDRDGNREIYLADADGTEPQRLTFDTAADYEPNFAPDGTRIAFTSDRAGGLDRIFVMGADGSAPTLLSSSDTSADHDPSFSPDGIRVAFAGDFVCPPGGGCGSLLGGAVYATSSDGQSGRTAIQPGIPLADIDWGVAAGSLPDPPPDTTPPDTELVSGPTGPTNDGTPSFAFTGTDDATATGQLEYSTRLDHGDRSTYTSDSDVTLAVIDGPHTISVRARDQAGNEDAIPAQRSFTVDTAAPTGTVMINTGALQTRMRTVTLTLSASDPAPASAVAAMRISNTASRVASAPWIPYARTHQWTLSSGAGTKTVYLQFRDAATNLSPIAQDTIRYWP